MSAFLFLAVAAAAAAPALGQAPPAEPPTTPSTPPPLPSAEEVIPDAPEVPPEDPRGVQREALFDLAINALAGGDLDLAERAFQEAAALPGDPTRSAVAASFADRVRRLRRAGQQRPGRAADAPRRMTTSTSPRATTTITASTAAAERPARAPLVAVTTLLGLSAWGWTLPAALGIDDSAARPFVGTYLLTAAASFVVPYVLTRKADITPGQVNMVWYGGTRGIWHGVFAGAVIAGNLSPERRYRAWTTSMLLGSLAELGGGLLLASHKQMTAGQVRTMAAVGDFGLLWGLGVGFFLHLDQRPTTDEQARGMAASGLIGSAAGLTGGYFLARRRNNTWGDGEVMRTSGLLGALLGFGFVDLLKHEVDLTERTVSTPVVSLSVLGAVAGDLMVRRTDFTVGQSLLIDLSAVSGALGAAGLGYLLLPSSDTGEMPPLLLAAAIGGIGGFSLAYWTFADESPAAGARTAASARGGTQVGVLPLLGRRGERGLAVLGTF